MQVLYVPSSSPVTQPTTCAGVTWPSSYHSCELELEELVQKCSYPGYYCSCENKMSLTLTQESRVFYQQP